MLMSTNSSQQVPMTITNRPVIPQSSSSSRSRYIISYPASHKKKNGILELNLRGKLLTWHSPVDPLKVSLLFDSIIQISRDEKEDRELLFVETRENKKYVFSFSGENKTPMRDKFYEMIKILPDELYEKEFRGFHEMEKRKIILILSEEYFKFLFDEMVMKKQILRGEDYWIFVKKMYPMKVTFCCVDQPMQLARSEELALPSNHIKFDYRIKRKLLSAYDELKRLCEYNSKLSKNEENFWKEFIKNQIQNNTEIVGGIRQIFFTSEEEKNINDSADKHSYTLSHSNKLLIKSDKGKFGKKYERIEKQRNFYSKYDGRCLNVAEFESKDKKIAADEDFNRKEISNLIESINNYSARKIENLNYIPKYKVNQVFDLPGVRKKSQEIHENVNGKDVKKKENVPMSMLDKIKEMKAKRDFNDKKVQNRCTEMFKKINQSIIQNDKMSSFYPLPTQENEIVAQIIRNTCLLRDLSYINERSKVTPAPVNKRMMKALAYEINVRMQNLTRSESLTGIQKSNLEILRAFFSQRSLNFS